MKFGHSIWNFQIRVKYSQINHLITKSINWLNFLTAMYTELWEGETGFEAQQVLCGESAPGKSGGNEVIMVIVVSQCDSGKSGW